MYNKIDWHKEGNHRVQLQTTTKYFFLLNDNRFSHTLVLLQTTIFKVVSQCLKIMTRRIKLWLHDWKCTRGWQKYLISQCPICNTTQHYKQGRYGWIASQSLYITSNELLAFTLNFHACIKFSLRHILTVVWDFGFSSQTHPSHDYFVELDDIYCNSTMYKGTCAKPS